MGRRVTVVVATVLVFIGVAALFLLFGTSVGRGGEGGPLFGPRVAVVELEGLIAETDDLVRELRHHRDNPSVRARACCASGSLPVRMARNTTLSMPRTISRIASVAKAARELNVSSSATDHSLSC